MPHPLHSELEFALEPLVDGWPASSSSAVVPEKGQGCPAVDASGLLEGAAGMRGPFSKDGVIYDISVLVYVILFPFFLAPVLKGGERSTHTHTQAHISIFRAPLLAPFESLLLPLFLSC